MAQELTTGDVAYEQLPGSVQRLLDALDGTGLDVLPIARQRLIEVAIRGVLQELTGMERNPNLGGREDER